jgi:hypothetical protein
MDQRTERQPRRLARIVPLIAVVAALVATRAGADGVVGPLAAVNGSNVFDVRDFGATGDGTTLDTEAIANAIRAAGGTVVFRSGVYRTGTFELLSSVLCSGRRPRESPQGHARERAAKGVP